MVKKNPDKSCFDDNYLTCLTILNLDYQMKYTPLIFE